MKEKRENKKKDKDDGSGWVVLGGRKLRRWSMVKKVVLNDTWRGGCTTKEKVEA